MNSQLRAAFRGVWLERFCQDLRYGCRMLVASPGFTTVAVLSLAIGIGANCAIFSFADALLFRPLPVARPGEVFTVGSSSTLEALNASSLVSSYRDYVDIRDRSRNFEGLAAFTYITAGVAIDRQASPRLKMGMLVSGNLLPLMQVEPTLGRSFRPEEDQVPGRDAVVVLGRTYWEQDFGSDAGVLGCTLRINGVEFTVIGLPCLGLNGGPGITHNEAFSFQVATDDQAETDRLWNAIVGNGGKESECGWCKDKGGLSWQITPRVLTESFTGSDRAAAKRVFDAMMTMKKIDVAAIEAARRG